MSEINKYMRWLATLDFHLQIFCYQLDRWYTCQHRSPRLSSGDQHTLTMTRKQLTYRCSVTPLYNLTWSNRLTLTTTFLSLLVTQMDLTALTVCLRWNIHEQTYKSSVTPLTQVQCVIEVVTRIYRWSHSMCDNCKVKGERNHPVLNHTMRVIPMKRSSHGLEA